MHPVVIIEGDGVGPELMKGALQVVEATGWRLELHYEIVGEACLHRHGAAILPRTLALIGETGAALKGPFTVPSGKGYHSPNRDIRRGLDLFACVRPLSDSTRRADLVVVRENTE